MQKDPTILAELKEISPLLAPLHGHNVFRVPDGYFDTVFDSIRNDISAEEILQRLPTPKVNQAVPDGYFENLSSNILKKLKAEEGVEENELSAYHTLSTISRRNVFTVPENYFELLPGKILSKVTTKHQAKIISMNRRPVYRFAVAAAIAIVLFLGTWFTVGNFDNHRNSFAAVNKKTVPDPAALKYNSEKAFDEGIASLTDDQIIAYLENHGSILDEDQLINNTDVSTMPDPLDYLDNDKALDNYLQKISNNNFSKQQ